MRTFFTIIFSILIAGASFAQIDNTFYNQLDQFLNEKVTDGKVDYQSLSKDAKVLNGLVQKIESANTAGWSGKEDQAFWINAYNVTVIKAVLDKYPLKSPLDVTGFFDKQKHLVAGEMITLNDIENKKLREVYEDARFHFVLVCGAVGCPPLISEAYRPETLETQLQEQTVIALNNPDFIKDGKKVAVSQIFEWYKADFENKETSTIDFINKYRKTPLRGKKLKYYSYNWNLNTK